MLRIVVISLPSSVQRRENIAKQFLGRKLAFEFFDAIKGEQAFEHVRGYDEYQFHLNTGRAANTNEVACYASHMAAWKMSVACKEPILILEDDARLCVQFVEGVSAIERCVQRRGFVRAALPTIRHSLEVEHLDTFRLRYCRRVPLQALAYAVSPDAARQLIAKGQIVEEPVDKYLQRFWRHGQPIFALRPYIVHLDPLGDTSDIGNREKDVPSLKLRIRRAQRKSANSIRRVLFNLRFMASRYKKQPGAALQRQRSLRSMLSFLFENGA